MGDTILTFQRIGFEDVGRVAPLIEISAGDVCLWGVLLEIGDADLARAAQMLSRDEQERVDRLASEQHRRQFMAAHAALRAVLSRYCGDHPRKLAILKSPSGKPFLSDCPSIRFNLTHSHGRAIIAVARDREIGVDLEKVRPEVDVVRLAKRFLSERDQAFIQSGGPVQRHKRFLQAWVAREAVFKADGRGMTFPLNHDSVELTDDDAGGCLVLGDGTAGETRRPVRFLPLEPGWVGAVAAEGTNWMVTYRGKADS